MSDSTSLFHGNPLYQLLSKQSSYSNELLQTLHSILHEQPESAGLTHPVEGSYIHLVCRHANQQNIAHRIVYALSNAGANPNITDDKGNTPLHEALVRDFADVGLDLVQALFRVGVDPRAVNNEGKTADAYLKDNPQLLALCTGYGRGMWAAIEQSELPEIERLVTGFIKIDCKANDGKTLLDKARALNSVQIIRTLADYQVTIEFVHSILACDWQRAGLIHEYEGQFIKVNAFDPVHRCTWIRPSNRTYSKYLLEICLDTQSSYPFKLIFNSPTLQAQVDVNSLGTDGLPFFFHAFDAWIPSDVQAFILSRCNLFIKSSRGETLLFHLVRLYDQSDDERYLNTFYDVLNNHPTVLTQRTEQGRTILDEIELTSSFTYDRLRPFYTAIREVLFDQLKNNVLFERLLLNSFGYHLLILFDGDSGNLNKSITERLGLLKLRQGISASMYDVAQAITNDDLLTIQAMFKSKSNVFLAKDWSGRTCVHLAVLHRRRQILSYICENFASIINVTDNLNRTPLHYASIMNDDIAIVMLQRANAKKLVDCFNLNPNDYVVDRHLCSEEFHAQGFPKLELQRHVPGLSDFLKLSFYTPLKRSIEANNVEHLKALNHQMNTMGFYLRDFDPNSYINDWLRGQRYTPLLFIALEHRTVAGVQCLMEFGLPPLGRMYISKSVNNNNSRCVSFRTRAEELECFDVIGIINDLEDDCELKSIFKRHLSPTESVMGPSPINSYQAPKRRKVPEQSSTVSRRDQKSSQATSQACTIL